MWLLPYTQCEHAITSLLFVKDPNQMLFPSTDVLISGQVCNAPFCPAYWLRLASDNHSLGRLLITARRPDLRSKLQLDLAQRASKLLDA